MNLLSLPDRASISCKSLWTEALPGEKGAPKNRIIHERCIQLEKEATLKAVGVHIGGGYAKCGSMKELDWPRNVVVLAKNDEDVEWRKIFEELDIEEPVGTKYFDLGNVRASQAIVQVRRSGVDDWWPSWNACVNGIILDGDYNEPAPVITNRASGKVSIHHEPVPPGVTTTIHGGEARFHTRFFQAGFHLATPGFSYLAIDETGSRKTWSNNVKRPSYHRKRDDANKYLVQGPRVYRRYPPDAGFFHLDMEGSTSLHGNVIDQETRTRDGSITYHYTWEINERGFTVTIEKHATKRIRLLHSSAWQISIDSTEAPLTALGKPIKRGETGLLRFPLLLHLAGKGSFLCSLLEHEGCGEVLGRFDSIRPEQVNTFEIKVGETPTVDGDFLLEPGTSRARIKFEVFTPMFATTADDAPWTVKEMVRTRAVSALTYRADTASFSNNGNSMHCPICLDSWSENAIKFQPFNDGIDPVDFLRDTLERWLLDAPAYASGKSIQDEDFLYEDEYVQSGTSALLGLANLLECRDDDTWFNEHKERIIIQLERMKKRDIDGDGIVESTHRVGISGEHQWSTNWWDVISFGYKDAFANAILYPALKRLGDVFSRKGMDDTGKHLLEWAENLKKHFLPVFFNEKTGWLAGWRCKKGQLHDYAFLFVNGAAVHYGLVDGELAKQVMGRLWHELQVSGFVDYRLGLPGNLWRIPDEDTATPQHGKPLGTYENGGATHSQAWHFVSGLHAVGMTKEGDLLLERLAESMTDGTAFGGVSTGVDWRTWDGRNCGYEGILCDQFGIIISALARWPWNGKKGI